jgi:hypothetical protein
MEFICWILIQIGLLYSKLRSILIAMGFKLIAIVIYSVTIIIYLNFPKSSILRKGLTKKSATIALN